MPPAQLVDLRDRLGGEALAGDRGVMLEQLADLGLGERLEGDGLGNGVRLRSM